MRHFEVKMVADGRLVMNAFKQFEPDICILDIMLPNIDGYTLGREIRLQTPTLPIIFLTAKADIQDKLQGLKLGADDYITKPFDLEELLLRIQNIIKRNTKGTQPSSIFKLNTCEINFDTFDKFLACIFVFFSYN